MEVTDALREVPLFEGLDMPHLDRIRQLSYLSSCDAGTLVISEGDKSASLYIVLSGAVKFFLGSEAGREVILGVAESGDYFGEIAFLDGRPRSASVMTISKSRFMIIPGRAFRTLLRRHPEILQAMLVGLTRRVRRLSDTVRGLALEDVHRRVAEVIVRLARSEGGKLVVPRRPSQQDLADMAGASRAMVGRAMRRLIDEGYVRVEGRRLVVLKRPPAEIHR